MEDLVGEPARESYMMPVSEMIRKATKSDIPAIIDMAEGFHKETGYPVSFDVGRVTSFISSLVGTSSAAIFVAGEPLRGFLAAIRDVSPMTGEMYANEVAFWVHPDQRRGPSGAALIDAYINWAISWKCDVARMTTQANMRPELVGIVYRRHGFEAHETAFIRRL